MLVDPYTTKVEIITTDILRVTHARKLEKKSKK